MENLTNNVENSTECRVKFFMKFPLNLVKIFIENSTEQRVKIPIENSTECGEISMENSFDKSENSHWKFHWM